MTRRPAFLSSLAAKPQNFFCEQARFYVYGLSTDGSAATLREVPAPEKAGFFEKLFLFQRKIMNKLFAALIAGLFAAGAFASTAAPAASGAKPAASAAKPAASAKK